MVAETASWQEMPCLEWTGYRRRNGYGWTKVRHQTVYVHRLMWEECFGHLAPGECVLHHCDNRACRQPLHLFKGSKSDNTYDMLAKGRNWNGRGVRGGRRIAYATTRWARNRDACMECGVATRPHNGRGLCTTCYGRMRTRERRVAA
jgi:hypothetical protein